MTMIIAVNDIPKFFGEFERAYIIRLNCTSHTKNKWHFELAEVSLTCTGNEWDDAEPSAIVLANKQHRAIAPSIFINDIVNATSKLPEIPFIKMGHIDGSENHYVHIFKIEDFDAAYAETQNLNEILFAYKIKWSTAQYEDELKKLEASKENRENSINKYLNELVSRIKDVAKVPYLE